MPAPTHEPLLTVREAAEFLKVTPETVRRRVRSGDIPACKLGQRAVRIRREDLANLAEPATDLEAHIAAVVAKAPPLTPEQRDRLSMLFRSPGGAAA